MAPKKWEPYQQFPINQISFQPIAKVRLLSLEMEPRTRLQMFVTYIALHFRNVAVLLSLSYPSPFSLHGVKLTVHHEWPIDGEQIRVKTNTKVLF